MMVFKWRMKRKTVSGIMLTLLLIGMLVWIVRIEPVKSEPKIIWVPTDYPTIQEAINAANLGDTIRVHNGTYHEHVTVNKENVSIIGDSRKTTFISGDGTGSVVLVTADNVTITDFTIKESGTSSPDLDSGIYVSSSGNRFERNNITNNSNGIYLSSSSSNLILGNIITNNTYDGIKLVHSSNNIFTDNTFRYNLEGIYSYYSQHNKIYHNSFINNTVKPVDYRPPPGYKDTWYDVYPSGGNYWSDYNGTDLHKGQNQDQPGSDGIGDSNHTINADNIDLYPLMLVVHNINTGLNYSRIQEAIDSEETKDGDTIRVDNITRYEHVTVSKMSLMLIGQRMNETIIDSSGTGTALNITASNVTVTGFTIQNSAYGIYISSNGNNITGNIVKDNTYGIKLSSSSNNWLRDNNITDNRYNFYVEGTLLSDFINDIDTSNTVDGKPIYYYVNDASLIINSFTHPNIGYLGLVNCTDTIVQNLALARNGQGLLVAFTNASTITGINASNDDYGIRLVSSSNNTIGGSSITNSINGITLSSSTNNVFINNTITDIDYAIKLGSSSGNNFTDNNITNVRLIGINLSLLSSNNTIEWSNITGPGISGSIGIYLSWSFNNTVYGNNVTNYTDNSRGIYLFKSNNTKINFNGITNNDNGIRLNDSYYNTIDGNSITSNTVGIGLFSGSSNNNITHNNITNNEECIYVSESSDNRIFHNNFINSPYKQELPGVTNMWDNGWPSGGNYWSDYKGVDKNRTADQKKAGSDGIADNPYTRGIYLVDHYPLMKPYCGEHDIEIRSVTLSRNVSISGYILSMDIKVVNYGHIKDYSENFLLSAYNETAFIDPENVTISYRNSKIITFTWNTTGLFYGNYTIKVNATQVSGEWNITDNTWIGYVAISGEGDVNGVKVAGKFVVDVLDMVIVINAIPSKLGSGPPWNPNADVNYDDKIDIDDLVIVINLIPTSYP